MNKGLDYNTQRPQLVMPEYGRIVQEMVETAINIEDRQQRQVAAGKIIRTMAAMFPKDQQTANFKHKLWNHLAYISGFRLDIDYPFNIEEAKAMDKKPEPLPYPQGRPKIRHYGKLVEESCAILSDMPEGTERDELARQTANQMRRMLLEYGHSNAREETVFSDLYRLTNGKIQLNPSMFRFDRTVMAMEKQTKKKKKKN